jgi:hypothetical protein
MAPYKQTKTNRGQVKPLPLDIALGRGGMANNHGMYHICLFNYVLRQGSSIQSSDDDILTMTPFLNLTTEGNIKYRSVVYHYKKRYLETIPRKKKGVIVQEVLAHLKRDGYRFVQKRGHVWVEAGEPAKRRKVVQALREGGPELRKQLEDGTAVPTNTSPGKELRGAHGAASIVSLEEDSDGSDDDLEPFEYSDGAATSSFDSDDDLEQPLEYNDVADPLFAEFASSSDEFKRHEMEDLDELLSSLLPLPTFDDLIDFP